MKIINPFPGSGLVLSAVLFSVIFAGCSSTPKIHSDPSLTSDEKIARYLSLQPLPAFLDPSKPVAERMQSDKREGIFLGCATALSCAIQQRDYKLAKWLLGYDIPTRGVSSRAYGWHYVVASPLLFDLSDTEASRFLALLLDAGYDPDKCSGYVETPLKIAVSKGYVESVKTLLSYHASIGQVRCKNTDHLYTGDNSDARVIRNWQTPLARAIVEAEGDDPVSLQILTLLLSHAKDPTRTSVYENRCSKNGNLLSYANCKNKPAVYAFLADYYRHSDKVTEAQRVAAFANEKRDYELLRQAVAKSRAIREANRQYEAKIRRQLDAMDDDTPTINYNYQTVAEMLQASSVSTPQSISSPGLGGGATAANGTLVLTAETIPAAPVKKVDNSCKERPHDCKAHPGSSSRYMKKLSQSLDYRYGSNALSCASLVTKIKASRLCETQTREIRDWQLGYDDDKKMVGTQAVIRTVKMRTQAIDISACACDASGMCSRAATWYCGDPDRGSGESTGKVRVE
ncbi:hypothetical protein Maes01_00260 [Microbulbifer aestuariivivens]|uniref:Ankyrin repeat domain-containing protein n=1 Tax=Microbulbifer aestuariivivens TaxID=1908308 RepID=A0ABP9WKI4_9GAMM